MIVHDSSWEVDASPEEIWAVFHPPSGQAAHAHTSITNPRVMEQGNVRIEIINEGDRNGKGLVRRTWYGVPWYFGGTARSWEIISEANPPYFQRYDAVTTPPNACATGWFRLEYLENGRARFHFHEEYRIENRIMAFFFEKRVHRYISKDNDKNIRNMIECGLAAAASAARSVDDNVERPSLANAGK